MTINSHLTTFAGRPVMDVPEDQPLPAVEGPVAWRFALWESDDQSEGPNEEFRQKFDRFLETEDAGAIEALVLGPWGYAAFADAPIAQLCQAADRLTGLRALFLGDITFEECEVSWIRLGDITPLLEAYPALEVLRVRGSERLALDPLRHPALRELAFETGGLKAGIVRSVLGSDLPALEHLELWLGVRDYGGDVTLDDLAPLLGGELFPALRSLGLRNAEHADEVAAALAAAPVVERLHTLDLSLGTLSDTGAEALLSGRPLGHLRRLDLHRHYLSEPMMERVTAALPTVAVDVSYRERDERYGRYTAVAE